MERQDFVAQYSIGDVVPPPYFCGVLPEGLDKQAFDDPFNTPGWVDHCKQAADRLGVARARFLGTPHLPAWRIAASKAVHYLTHPVLAAQHLVTGLACSRHLLPAAAMIRDAHLRNERVSVLDVGGGFGDNFFELLHVLPRNALRALRYVVVDNEPSCELGRAIFSGYEAKPTFTSDYASIAGEFDVVLVIGTLQYLSGWREALTGIARKARSHLYMARSPISLDTHSYTTNQLICPALGSHAKRLLGVTKINVVGLRDLRGALPDLQPCFEFIDTDYSEQFARLPNPWANVRYINMAWHR